MTTRVSASDRIRSRWPQMSIDERRDAISAVVDHIRVTRVAHRGGAIFDGSRIQIEFHGGARTHAGDSTPWR